MNQDNVQFERPGHGEIDPTPEPALFAGLTQRSFLEGPNPASAWFERIRQFDEMSYGFLEAAEAAASDHPEHPLERFYAIMLLLRQSLELAFKHALTWWGGYKGSVQTTHDLRTLTNTLAPLLPIDLTTADDWRFVDEQVEVWDRLDRKGFAFRYPDDRALMPRDVYAALVQVPDSQFAVSAHRRCVDFLLCVAVEGQRH